MAQHRKHVTRMTALRELCLQGGPFPVPFSLQGTLAALSVSSLLCHLDLENVRLIVYES